jgi:hypothetical protein
MTKAGEAAAYANEVVAVDFEKAGEDDVFAKLRRDFDAKGTALSDHAIQRKMDELLETAKSEIEREVKK